MDQTKLTATNSVFQIQLGKSFEAVVGKIATTTPMKQALATNGARQHHIESDEEKTPKLNQDADMRLANTRCDEAYHGPNRRKHVSKKNPVLASVTITVNKLQMRRMRTNGQSTPHHSSNEEEQQYLLSGASDRNKSPVEPFMNPLCLVLSAVVMIGFLWFIASLLHKSSPDAFFPAWENGFQFDLESTPATDAFKLAIVADLDKRSRVEGAGKPQWRSVFLEGVLTRTADGFHMKWDDAGRCDCLDLMTAEHRKGGGGQLRNKTTK